MKEIDKIGIEVAELYVKAGLCKSKTEARKLIKQGAVRIDGQRIADSYARFCLIDNNKYVIIESNPAWEGDIR